MAHLVSHYINDPFTGTSQHSDELVAGLASNTLGRSGTLDPVVSMRLADMNTPTSPLHVLQPHPSLQGMPIPPRISREWAGDAVKGRSLPHPFNAFAPSISSYFQTLLYSPRLMQQTSLSFSVTAPPRYTRFNDERSVGGVSTSVYSIEADVEHNIGVATSRFVAGSPEPPSSFDPSASNQFYNTIVDRHNQPSPMFPYPVLENGPHTLTPAYPSYNHSRSVPSVSPTLTYGVNTSRVRSSPRGISHREVRPHSSGSYINSLNTVTPPGTLRPARAHLGPSTVRVRGSAASSPVTTAHAYQCNDPPQLPLSLPPLPPPSPLSVTDHTNPSATVQPRLPEAASVSHASCVGFYNRSNRAHVTIQEPDVEVRIGSRLSRCTPLEAYLTHTQELKQDPYVKGLKKKVGDMPRSIEYDAYNIVLAYKDDVGGISDHDQVAFPAVRMAQKMSFVFNVRRLPSDTHVFAPLSNARRSPLPSSLVSRSTGSK